MPRLPVVLALAMAVAWLSSGAAEVSCGVCAPSIFFEGLTRTLTNTRQDTGNTVACTYGSPAISGLAPACLYQNVEGTLTFTNTGPPTNPDALPGACPGIELVQKTSC